MVKVTSITRCLTCEYHREDNYIHTCIMLPGHPNVLAVTCYKHDIIEGAN